MLPLAQPWLEQPARRPRRHLDLDDLESVSRRRIAALLRANGAQAAADAEARAAEQAASLEHLALTTFDRVYVCSEADRQALGSQLGTELSVLPNALPRAAPLEPPPTNGPFTFLFVGTLGYYPNEDAVLLFGHEVLPRIARAARRAVRFLIVGTGPTPAIHQLASRPGVELIGPVPDPTAAYRAAHAAVVPIRAGGGTRIKVLEAFSYRRPVVSTTLGAEGIAARDGEHLLLADAPEAFAEACLRLVDEPDLSPRLAARAQELFESTYSFEAVARRLPPLC
jgi:glycosyltransferase involved in cell wall biosynthesis